MKIKEALKHAKDVLYNVPDRDVDSAWIICAVTGLSRNMLHFEGETELTEKQEQLLEAILQRRATREPLQYIFGTVPFVNIELKTDSRALIPRDETACMTENAIGIIKSKNYKTVLDLCTGSGAIALAIKKNADVSVVGSDISENALSLAMENVQNLGLNVEFIQSDLFENLQERKFDVIISNPPYIPTKDMEKLERELSFEPSNALDGGADGLDFYRDIALEAKEHLNNNGMLIMEIGFDEGDALKLLLARNGYTNITVTKDYAGLDRVVTCFYEELI